MAGGGVAWVNINGSNSGLVGRRVEVRPWQRAEGTQMGPGAELDAGGRGRLRGSARALPDGTGHQPRLARVDQRTGGDSSAGAGGLIGLFRLDPDGDLDTPFGTEGKSSSSISNGAKVAGDLAVDSEGRYLVIGTMLRDGAEPWFVARFWFAPPAE